jgi:hypothetical protein
MVSVKDLRDMIRKHREAECPKLSKMKKADLVKYAEEKGLMKNAPVKEMKEKKPRANKVVKSAPAAVNDSSMSKAEILAYVKKLAVDFVKANPTRNEYDAITIKNIEHPSEKISSMARELHDEVFKKKASSPDAARLQQLIMSGLASLAKSHQDAFAIRKSEEKRKGVSVEDVMKKIEVLRVKLSNAKTDRAQMEIEDEIDELKRLLPRRRG